MPHSFSSTGLPSLSRLQLRSKDNASRCTLPMRSSRLTVTLSSRAIFPDSRSCCGWMASFCCGRFLGSSLIQGKVLMSSPRAFSSAATSWSMLALAAGREVLLYPVLSDGFTQSAVGHGGALFPARRRFLLSCQRLPEESKFSSKKALGRLARGSRESCASADTPSSPRLVRRLSGR